MAFSTSSSFITTSPSLYTPRSISKPATNPTRTRIRCIQSDPPPANSSGSGSESDAIKKFLKREYEFGFSSNFESFSIPKGLNESTIRTISKLKSEPEWMLRFRLSAYRRFLSMAEPTWSDNTYPKIDFDSITYFSEPKEKSDPELVNYFDKLGVPISENKRLANVAVDVVCDSTSIATTNRKTLEEAGVIFCSISEAIQNHPDIVQKYLGKVVPPGDNYFSALNSAVFSDGTFVYVPKDTKVLMPISTYFRIHDKESGQFERTLIVVEEGGALKYSEDCTALRYDKNQMHAAVVELYCAERGLIEYSTVQNWYAGDEKGRGGIYNFVTKRGICDGAKAKICWTQVETGSAITWKYPSVILRGDESVGEFHSVTLTNDYQQADTGTKMIHQGKNTRSKIVSKGISAGMSRNCFRGLVQVMPKADGARNFSQCDSMLFGDMAAANTYPYIQVRNETARVEHEASTSKIGEDQLFYFHQRGIDHENAVAAIVCGFCRDVTDNLPDEFPEEVKALLKFKLEGSVG